MLDRCRAYLENHRERLEDVGDFLTALGIMLMVPALFWLKYIFE